MTDRLTQYALICLIALPLWVLLRRPWKRPPAREICLAVFVLLMTALLAMVLAGQWDSPAAMLASAKERIFTGQNIRLKPLETIRSQLQALPDEEAAIQLLGNTLLFMPWGFFLPLLWRRFRTLPKLMAMAFLLTFCIEFIQLFIGRMTDVDDLLLNFIGSMAGSGVWLLLHRLIPSTDKISI